ncbi:MerR family transcriptional regulator [Undibacterium sp. Ren11W]|uniref:MerR family transcriptional regulator n=1 Tax=Undibacterium sp. Ren11W TaxID=3413045 RepID=UPI003BF591F9
MSNKRKNSAIDIADKQSEATFRSGAAARLSGVPVETLRVWERRYGVTDPHRSEQGQRQYSFGDVRRLGLIKQLVDAGNPIGTVATLDVPQLLAQLDAASGLPSAQLQASLLEQGIIRIAVVGTSLRHALLNLDQGQSKLQLNVVQTASNLQQASSQLQDAVVDVVVIELGEITEPAVQIALIRQVQQSCQARAALVLYRFSSSDAIRQLRQADCYVARIPTDMQEIESQCRSALAQVQLSQSKKTQQEKKSVGSVHGGKSRTASQLPPRLLTDDALSLIAKSADAIHCECPRHLVDLLQMLSSFERYSAQCENRNDDDASLHRDLHHTAAHARASLEQALLRVAQAEGIIVQ